MCDAIGVIINDDDDDDDSTALHAPAHLQTVSNIRGVGRNCSHTVFSVQSHRCRLHSVLTTH